MSAIGTYRRLMASYGRRAVLTRNVVNQPALRVENVRVRIRGLTQHEIAGGINAAERQVLILAEDVPASFGRVRNNDRVLVDDITLTLNRMDNQSHREGDTLLAYSGYATGG